MERYEAYKDSGVEWIGDIPEGWYVRRIKTAVRRKSESGHPEETVLSLYRDYGIVIKDSRDDNFNKTSENIDSYRFVEIDDLVVNKMKAWQGSLAVSKYQGIVSPAYYVYTITSADIVPHYMHYQLRDSSYLPEYRRLSGGIRPAQWDLSSENFVNIPMLVPTLYEQEAIADYLDAKTTEIDALVAGCEQEIELLREYRKAIISEAVTKGIEPDAPMRDPGVEWIDAIPVGWSVSRIAWIRELPTSYGIIKMGDIPDEDGVPTLRCSDVKEGQLDLSSVRVVSEVLSNEYSRTILKGREVLINVRGTLGGCSTVPDTCKGWNIAREVARIDVKVDFDPRFIMYALLSNYFWAYLNSNLAGSVYQGLNIELLERALIVHPNKEEQNAIAAYLDAKTTEIDSLIETKQFMADKLREYRRSLISEAVTGKFKVPGV